MKTKALLDANILYSAPLRDIFVQLAVDGVFIVRWTDAIHEEWITSLLKQRRDINRDKLEGTRASMDAAIKDSLITGYESRIPEIELPDDNDRHVVAAAIAGKCDIIVTENISHFPAASLRQYGVRAERPDDFLHAQLAAKPIPVCRSIRKVRMRLSKPPYTVEKYLDILATGQNLVTTADTLKRYSGSL